MRAVTLYAADEDPKGKYMWSLNPDPRRTRVLTEDAPEMIADVYKDDNAAGGYFLRAFALLKLPSQEISEAKRKRELQAVSGRDGDDDLSEALLGRPVYERRVYTESFALLRRDSDVRKIVLPGRMEWSAMASEITNFLNSHVGQIRIAPSDDTGFYWLGRVSAEWHREEHYAVIDVKADVEPYKLEISHSAETWLWDDFSFSTGIIREYGDIAVPANSVFSLEVPVRAMDMEPEFMLVDGDGTESEDDVKVSLDSSLADSLWSAAAFQDFSKTDDRTDLYATSPFTIPGCAERVVSRTLYIKNTTGTEKHLAVKVRGGSL